MKYLDNNGLLYVIKQIKTWLNGKVSKEDGKGLSTNDYTTEEKNKLAGLSNYTLPTASADTKGGVKIGSGLQMNGDVLSATGGGTADAVDWENVTNKPTKLTDFTNDLAYKTAYDASTNKIATESDLAIKTLAGTIGNPIILSSLEPGLYKIKGIVRDFPGIDSTDYVTASTISVSQHAGATSVVFLEPTYMSQMGVCFKTINITRNGSSYVSDNSSIPGLDYIMTLNNELGKNFADPYDESKSYAVGDLTTYSGILYKVIGTISSGTDFYTAITGNLVQQIDIFEVIDGKGYQTSSQVETAITSKGYQTSSQVESAITSKGYQTSSQVETAITSKGYQTANDVETAITNKISSVMTYKGTVANYSDLPTNAKVGDTYNITNKSSHNKAGDNAAWNGTSWDILAGTIDLSGYYTKDEMKALTNDEIDNIFTAE